MESPSMLEYARPVALAEAALPRTWPVGPAGRSRVLLLLLGVAAVCFSALRLVLLWLAKEEAGLPLTQCVKVLSVGLIYDLAFLCMFGLGLAGIGLLPNRLFSFWPIRLVFFLGLFGILCALSFDLVAEWYFWDEFRARFNFIAVDYLIYRREVTDNIKESYPLTAILPTIALASGSLLYSSRRWIWRELGRPLRLLKRAQLLALFVAASAILALLLQADPRERLGNNYAVELASNGPYQFVSAFRANALDFKRFYALGPEDELTSILRADTVLPGEALISQDTPFSIARTAVATESKAGPNVFLICVESLSSSFLTRFGSEEGLTPFLDTLAKDSLLFTHCYATGTRTTRGLEALTLSLPPTPGRSIVKRPDGEKYASFGKVLGDTGYDRAFLYGGRGYFDNMNAFFAGNGYRVIDQMDIGRKETTFENAWGVCDEDLYRRAIREADDRARDGKPFFFHVMTTSNHRPYTYPEGRVSIPPGTNREGAIQYTDYALSVLFAEARTRPWFHDTIFVVIADHCASSAGRVGLPVDKYHIPFLIHAPGQIAAGEIDKLCSQVDVAPTLLAMLGISYTSRFFGRDILNPAFQGRAFIGNYQKLGLLDASGLAILSPQSKIDVMESPFGEQTIRQGSAAEPLVQRAQAAYQAADHIIRTGMNRW